MIADKYLLYWVFFFICHCILFIGVMLFICVCVMSLVFVCEQGGVWGSQDHPGCQFSHPILFETGSHVFHHCAQQSI